MTSELHNALMHFRSCVMADGAPFETLMYPDARPRDEVRDQLLATTGVAPAELVTWFSWKIGPEWFDPPPFVIPYMQVAALGFTSIVASDSSYPGEQRIALLQRPDHNDMSYASVESGRDLVEVHRLNPYDSPIRITGSLVEYVELWTEFATEVVHWDSELDSWTGGGGLDGDRGIEVMRVWF